VEKDRLLFLTFLRGANAPIVIIVSPSGLFGKWEEEKKKEIGAYIFRGAYAPIAILVSPSGLFLQRAES
jgi:hypothetical protein